MAYALARKHYELATEADRNFKLGLSGDCGARLRMSVSIIWGWSMACRCASSVRPTRPRTRRRCAQSVRCRLKEPFAGAARSRTSVCIRAVESGNSARCQGAASRMAGGLPLAVFARFGGCQEINSGGALIYALGSCQQSSEVGTTSLPLGKNKRRIVCFLS